MLKGAKLVVNRSKEQNTGFSEMASLGYWNYPRADGHWEHL